MSEALNLDTVSTVLRNADEIIKTKQSRVKELETVLRTLEPDVAAAKQRRDQEIEKCEADAKQAREATEQERRQLSASLQELAASLSSLRAQQAAIVSSERSKLADALRNERNELGMLQSQKDSIQVEIDRLKNILSDFKSKVLEMKV